MSFVPAGEQEVYAGRFIRVTRASFLGPDGHTFERDIVHHPGAVGVVPLHDDGTVTLVRQFRVALGCELLEIPAGIRDVIGEPPEITAARELAEEVGLAAESFELLCGFHNSPGFTDELVHVFRARVLTEVPNDLQGIEERHMTVERIALGEAVAMIGSGLITDAKTIIGLSLVWAGDGRL